MSAPIAVADAGDPRLAHRRHVRLADAELLLHLLGEHPLRVGHHLRGERVAPRRASIPLAS